MKAFCEQRTLPDGLSYERFYRISNGTTMMGMTDIMFWASVIPGFAATMDRAIRNLIADMDMRRRRRTTFRTLTGPSRYDRAEITVRAPWAAGSRAPGRQVSGVETLTSR